MNRRSPRVVLNASIPRRGAPPGESRSQTLIPTRSSPMNAKKTAVCHVHAIQLIAGSRPSPRARRSAPSSSRPIRLAGHTRPSENPFAM